MKHEEEIDALFDDLVEKLKEELDDFGKYLAVDGKAHELFKKIKEEHVEIIERCEYGIGDRGYDDGKLIEKLWGDYGIKPVIDIRNMWKDGEETKALGRPWNVVYNYRGE